jgi:hypothetical protein
MKRQEFSMTDLQQTEHRALAAKRITAALLLVICIVAAVFV